MLIWRDGIEKKTPLPFGPLRREWGFAPLCGVAATFSGYSKDPSRPLGGIDFGCWLLAFGS